MAIKCGYCGAELERLGADHDCDRGRRVAAFAATGDMEVLEADDR